MAVFSRENKSIMAGFMETPFFFRFCTMIKRYYGIVTNLKPKIDETSLINQRCYHILGQYAFLLTAQVKLPILKNGFQSDKGQNSLMNGSAIEKCFWWAVKKLWEFPCCF